MGNLTKDIIKSGSYWSKRDVQIKRPIGGGWYYLPSFRRYANRKSCGLDLEGYGDGFIFALQAKLSKLTIKRAISIGCGSASKELQLLRLGFVEKFDLYEASEVRLNSAKLSAAKLGLLNRVNFHLSITAELPNAENYDLVFWSAALHHMLDTQSAILWSYNALRSKGLFVMNEYVGPNRFQWTNQSLVICDLIRENLPGHFFIGRDGKMMRSHLTPRVNIDSLIQQDPTEAADSENIIFGIKNIFQNPTIIPLGGSIYDLVFRKILHNVDDMRDANLVNEILKYDQDQEDSGQYHFAISFAEK
jgi:SAM-dependent methyltransferase